MFSYALNPQGLLFLGTAETVGEFTDEFVTLDPKWKIYRVKEKTRPAVYPFPQHPAWRLKPGTGEGEQFTLAYPGFPRERSAEEIVLSALPASVLVDRNYQVIFSSGDTRKYIGLSTGKPKRGILEMVRPELRAGLASGLHEAASQGREVVRESGRLKHNGDKQSVKIVIKPVISEATEKPTGQMVIIFQDIPLRKRRRSGELPSEARCRELEQELQFTKETLRGTIEELETANEELRSANEEYQSTNEELQSSNEELETSREELQSVNEELTTLNNEYQKKLEELSAVNDDMKNLLTATGVATIFLDVNLRLLRFTPAATQIFNFKETDIGRPLTDITHKIETDNLPEQAKEVLDTLIPKIEGIRTRDGKWFSMRIHPYRTTDNTIAGVGISFIDISEQEKLRVALSVYQAIIDTLHHPVVVLDDKLKVVSANREFYRAFQVQREETEGRLLYDLGDRQWDIPALRKLMDEILSKNSEFHGYKVEHDFPGIGYRVMLLNARRIYDEKGATQRILLALEDITGREGEERFSQRRGERTVK